MQLVLSVYQRVWQFAWPAIISNISIPLMGLVDSAVLGHLSSSAYLGGVAVATTVFSMIFWAFGFLRMGTTGLVAQAKGKNDVFALRKWLLQSIVLAVGIGVTLIILSPWILQFAQSFFESSDQVSKQTEIYFHTRIISAPAVLTNYALIGWLIGMHKPKGPLVILVLSNVINIILDLLFVLGLGWATQGAAMATVIADYTALAAGLIIVRRVLTQTGGHFTREMIVDITAFRRLAVLNRHLFVRTLCLLSVQTFFTAQGSRLGDHTLAANALLMNLLLLISNCLDGFAHAAEALTGEAIGKSDPQLFRQVVKATGWCSLYCGALLCVFLGFSGTTLLDGLTNIPEVVTQATIYLPWLIAMP